MKIASVEKQRKEEFEDELKAAVELLSKKLQFWRKSNKTTQYPSPLIQRKPLTF